MHTSLFPCGPESIRQVFRISTTTNRHCFLVLGDGDGVQLWQVDLNAIVHPTKCSKCTVVAIVSKDGNVEFGCEFDLQKAVLNRLLNAYWVGNAYDLGDILLSPWHENDVWSGGFQVRPTNRVRGELGAAWEIDPGCRGKIWRNFAHIDAYRRCSRGDILGRGRAARSGQE